MKRVEEISKLSRIEALLKDKNFLEASIELDTALKLDLPARDKAYRCLLIAELNLNLGNYDKAMCIDEAVSYYRNSPENDKFARAKYLAGWLELAVGDNVAAVESILEAYATFRRCGDHLGQARALNRLAYIHRLSGEFEQATSCLKKCIDIYTRLNHPKTLFSFSNNLATLYRAAGKVNDALGQYENSKLHRSQLPLDYLFSYELGYAITLALKGFFDKAAQMFDEANLIPEQYRKNKAIYFEYLGWFELCKGDYRQASDTLEKGVELANKISPTSDHISQTKRLLADAYLGLKEYNLAQKYAEEALAVAEKINERAEIAACWRVFAQVALHNGDKEKARGWFKKAVELFSMISSRYELAVTRYLAGKSGLYGEGERAALLYLAKEYFESEEIAPYMEKVNRELEGDTGQCHRTSLNLSRRNGCGFIGASPAIVKIRKLAENIARSSMSMLLTGPTGSGKDQLARYIHFCSGRPGEFIPVNCAAIPEGMVESELFGFKKGAFTGAESDKPGLFEMADNGTLYLNEIADTTPQFQAKLLEVIESRRVRRLGEVEYRPVEFRIIAATNQNLETLLKEGRFRPDLYHRLNEVAITLPPLSERMLDIPLLARYFLEHCQVDFNSNGGREQLRELCHHLEERDWPGNVRELRAEIQRLHYLAGGDLGGILALVKEEVSSERELLFRTLERTGWNQSATARELGMTEAGVRYKIRRFGLERKGNSKSSS